MVVVVHAVYQDLQLHHMLGLIFGVAGAPLNAFTMGLINNQQVEARNLIQSENIKIKHIFSFIDMIGDTKREILCASFLYHPRN